MERVLDLITDLASTQNIQNAQHEQLSDIFTFTNILPCTYNNLFDDFNITLIKFENDQPMIENIFTNVENCYILSS